MSFPTMDYFRAIQNANGIYTEKDRKVAEYQRRFGAEFDSSVNVVHGALRNDVPQDFIIVPTKTGCNLFARPGETFNIGDIIYYNTLHWLVTDINFHDDLNRSGSMVRCNRQLRWQNQQTGKIVERWCLATKPDTSNIQEGMAIANSNREFKVQVAYDEETIMVGLDRRFLLEVIDGQPKAYQVTSVDTLTNRYQDAAGGFLVWNLSQCEYDPLKDNAELMIADYITVPPAPSVPTGEPRSEITGATKVRSGTSRVYHAAFYGGDGAVDSDAVPVWNVSYSGAGQVSWGDNGAFSLSVGDNAAPGEQIVLSVRDAGGLYPTAEFVVEVIALL